MEQKLYIIDIDGCLNYYPKTKIDFANYYYKLNPPILHLFSRFRTLGQLKSKLSETAYEKMTAAYRLSNYKHKAICNENLAKLIRKWKSEGAFIYIITARQDNSFMQKKTKEWLKDNNIPYDSIAFTRAKQAFLEKCLLSDRFGNATMIDDNLNNLVKCEDTYERLLSEEVIPKCKFVWVMHKYNKHHRFEISRYSRITTTTYRKIDEQLRNGGF